MVNRNSYTALQFDCTPAHNSRKEAHSEREAFLRREKCAIGNSRLAFRFQAKISLKNVENRNWKAKSLSGTWNA
jgi:hypothetical protein